MPLSLARATGVALVPLPQRPCTSMPPKAPRCATVCSGATTASTTSTDSSTSAGTSSTTPIIQVPVTAKTPAPPPEPVPIVHSTIYIQHSRKPLLPTDSSDREEEQQQQQQQALVPMASTSAKRRPSLDDDEEPQSNNSIMWALKQVDKSLDLLEDNPLPLQREIYEFSKGPVGTATSTAINVAAQATVAASKEAVKAALPVGQWLMREGAKAAVKLVTAAVTESAKGAGGGGKKAAAQQQQQQPPPPPVTRGPLGPGKTGTSKIFKKSSKGGR